MDKCVCCERETKGTYGEGGFPVCSDCYKNGNLANLFNSVIFNNTERLQKVYESAAQHWESIIVSAHEWDMNSLEKILK